MRLSVTSPQICLYCIKDFYAFVSQEFFFSKLRYIRVVLIHIYLLAIFKSCPSLLTNVYSGKMFITRICSFNHFLYLDCLCSIADVGLVRFKGNGKIPLGK